MYGQSLALKCVGRRVVPDAIRSRMENPLSVLHSVVVINNTRSSATVVGVHVGIGDDSPTNTIVALDTYGTGVGATSTVAYARTFDNKRRLKYLTQIQCTTIQLLEPPLPL